jgi:hypothetical protein
MDSGILDRLRSTFRDTKTLYIAQCNLFMVTCQQDSHFIIDAEREAELPRRARMHNRAGRRGQFDPTGPYAVNSSAMLGVRGSQLVAHESVADIDLYSVHVFR